MTSTFKLVSACLLGTLLLTAAYVLALLGVAALVPDAAHGSLLVDAEGRVVGSRLVAQRFESPTYVWPRPSAVDHAADRSGGSNLAPSNPALRERVVAELARLAADAEHPVPLELVLASGSGLDPHVTLAGALWQAPRIAAARDVDRREVEERLRSLARVPNPWSPPLVNVLEANLELDASFGTPDRAR